jgi:predicted subunit of tRNA(5-methylaminomethyl-2-thiouridylate) methyltransferase
MFILSLLLKIVMALGTLGLVTLEFGIMRSAQAVSKGIKLISFDLRLLQVATAVLYISNFSLES